MRVLKMNSFKDMRVARKSAPADRPIDPDTKPNLDPAV